MVSLHPGGQEVRGEGIIATGGGHPALLECISPP